MPKLIAGRNAYICTDCVSLCVAIHVEENVTIAVPVTPGPVLPGASPGIAVQVVTSPAPVGPAVLPTSPTTGKPPMGRLHADWRADYIEDATAQQGRDDSEGRPPGDADQCVFCAILADRRPDNELHILDRGESVMTILNAYPYTSGHAMVMPLRHVRDLSELSEAERTELWADVIHLTEVIQRAYKPEGLNVGINLGRAAGAGIPGHLHVHVVPRWNGDTNFMTAVGETRVVPESLDRTWAKLVAKW